MKRKFIGHTLVILVIAIIAVLNINVNSSKLSDISISNVEALASEGEGEGGSDACYETIHYDPVYKSYARYRKYCADNCEEEKAIRWSGSCSK